MVRGCFASMGHLFFECKGPELQLSCCHFYVCYITLFVLLLWPSKAQRPVRAVGGRAARGSCQAYTEVMVQLGQLWRQTSETGDPPPSWGPAALHHAFLAKITLGTVCMAACTGRVVQSLMAMGVLCRPCRPHRTEPAALWLGAGSSQHRLLQLLQARRMNREKLRSSGACLTSHKCTLQTAPADTHAAPELSQPGLCWGG